MSADDARRGRPLDNVPAEEGPPPPGPFFISPGPPTGFPPGPAGASFRDRGAPPAPRNQGGGPRATLASPTRAARHRRAGWPALLTVLVVAAVLAVGVA